MTGTKLVKMKIDEERIMSLVFMRRVIEKMHENIVHTIEQSRLVDIPGLLRHIFEDQDRAIIFS